MSNPGYCPYCLEQTEKDLKNFPATHDLPNHPTNGDTGIYNGMLRVWVNGYWISPLCTPEWIQERIQSKSRPALSEAKKAELSEEHESIRKRFQDLVGMDGKPTPEEPPY
mgnify:CR=1 FL=1